MTADLQINPTIGELKQLYDKLTNASGNPPFKSIWRAKILEILDRHPNGVQGTHIFLNDLDELECGLLIMLGRKPQRPDRTILHKSHVDAIDAMCNTPFRVNKLTHKELHEFIPDSELD